MNKSLQFITIKQMFFEDKTQREGNNRRVDNSNDQILETGVQADELICFI